MAKHPFSIRPGRPWGKSTRLGDSLPTPPCQADPVGTELVHLPGVSRTPDGRTCRGGGCDHSAAVRTLTTHHRRIEALVGVVDGWNEARATRGGADRDLDAGRSGLGANPERLEVVGLVDCLRAGNRELARLVDGLAVELSHHHGSQAWGEDAEDSTPSSQLRS
jgi:hypothetical protein